MLNVKLRIVEQIRKGNVSTCVGTVAATLLMKTSFLNILSGRIRQAAFAQDSGGNVFALPLTISVFLGCLNPLLARLLQLACKLNPYFLGFSVLADDGVHDFAQLREGAFYRRVAQ